MKGSITEVNIDSNYFNSTLALDGSTLENVQVHEINPWSHSLRFQLNCNVVLVAPWSTDWDDWGLGIKWIQTAPLVQVPYSGNIQWSTIAVTRRKCYLGHISQKKMMGRKKHDVFAMDLKIWCVVQFWHKQKYRQFLYENREICMFLGCHSIQ